MYKRGFTIIGLLFWFSTAAWADPNDTFHCLTGPLDGQPLLICVRQHAHEDLTTRPVYCAANDTWKNITTPDSYNWYADFIQNPNAAGKANHFCSGVFLHAQFATGTCHGPGAPGDCIPLEDPQSMIPNYDGGPVVLLANNTL